MKRYCVLLVLLISWQAAVAGECSGKFVNPITDICWTCIFPITIGSLKVVGSDLPDTKNPGSPVCACAEPFPRIGISIGYWEPVRLVDVTRKPFCMVGLGGISIDIGKYYGGGTTEPSTKRQNGSFYDVHWYVYPVIYWLSLITDALCVETEDFDIAYLTEIDPTWRDDELSFILNPEAALFSNPVAQAACGADCLKASVGKPLDPLFWCAGCQGSMYPLNGWVGSHVGAIQASTLLVQRMTYKLHREGLLWGTLPTGGQGLCSKYPMPIIKKSQYRYQMTYPLATATRTLGCQPYGRTTSLWGSGREFPVKGEDFGYLIWRKRSCCAA